MRRVVFAPIPMQEATFPLHLPKKRRARIRRQYVKSRAFEAIGFNPVRGPFENRFVVAIEAEHETAVHLDSVVMKDADAPRLIFGARRAFVRI